MDLNYFKNKKLENLNLEELEFLYKNSYLNDIYYLGRKFELEGKKLNVNNLIQFDPYNITNIVLNFENFEKSGDIKYFNNLLPYMKNFYTTLTDKFDEFINNRILIEEFSSLYYMSYILQIFLSKNNSNILHTRYKLWGNDLVRSIHPEVLNENFEWYHYNVHMLILPFAEHQMFNEAIKAYELFEKSKYFDIYAKFYEHKQRIIYYKTHIALITMQYDLMSNIFQDLLKTIFENKMFINSLNVLTYLKLSEIFSMNYRAHKDEEYLNYSKKFIHMGFDAYKKHDIGYVPDLCETKLYDYFNIEYFREPTLRLMYYLKYIS